MGAAQKTNSNNFICKRNNQNYFYDSENNLTDSQYDGFTDPENMAQSRIFLTRMITNIPRKMKQTKIFV